MAFRARRSGGAACDILVDDRHGRPPLGTGPARPEGRDATPAQRCATGPGRQARRQERRGRQDVSDQIARQVLERPGQALGQQVRPPQERQTVVAVIWSGQMSPKKWRTRRYFCVRESPTANFGTKIRPGNLSTKNDDNLYDYVPNDVCILY